MKEKKIKINEHSNFSIFGWVHNFVYSGLEVLFFSGIIIVLGILSGCSSAPKKPAEIFTNRIIAANQLNMANQTANQGRYEDALLILEEARRLAIGADDPALRIKTATSRGNILFSMGRHSEAFSDWENAAAEGDASGEIVLAALARIYAIRAELVLLSNEVDQSGKNLAAEAEELKTRLTREIALARSDSLSAAAGYVTLAMASKQIGAWAEAESTARRALDIHEKNRYLEEAAYDWFIIASIRSVAGNYEPSLQALRMAISYDRRAENSFGLASSWQAMGDVYQKAGQPEESIKAYRRAVEIFKAINLNNRASELEAKL